MDRERVEFGGVNRQITPAMNLLVGFGYPFKLYNAVQIRHLQN